MALNSHTSGGLLALNSHTSGATGTGATGMLPIKHVNKLAK